MEQNIALKLLRILRRNWKGEPLTDIEARKTAEQGVAVQNTRLQLLLKLTKETQKEQL